MIIEKCIFMRRLHDAFGRKFSGWGRGSLNTSIFHFHVHYVKCRGRVPWHWQARADTVIGNCAVSAAATIDLHAARRPPAAAGSPAPSTEGRRLLRQHRHQRRFPGGMRQTVRNDRQRKG